MTIRKTWVCACDHCEKPISSYDSRLELEEAIKQEISGVVTLRHRGNSYILCSLDCARHVLNELDAYETKHVKVKNKYQKARQREKETASARYERNKKTMWEDALTVDCPRCKSSAGVRCFNLAKYRNGAEKEETTLPHLDRTEIARAVTAANA